MAFDYPLPPMSDGGLVDLNPPGEGLVDPPPDGLVDPMDGGLLELGLMGVHQGVPLYGNYGFGSGGWMLEAIPEQDDKQVSN